MPDDLTMALRHTVQDVPQVDKLNGASSVGFWLPATERGPILPAWGTRERERVLRLYDRHELNNLWQGARAGLTKKIVATPYELVGPKYGANYAKHFDGVLRDAQFGAGWGQFLSLLIRDFMRFDGGAYFEIIAPGNPLKAPTGRMTGIAHLDAFRCLPTGDPEYPVVYYSRMGKLHVLHHTRVFHWLDAPDGDQDHPGYGECSLTRAIALVQREILMGRYVMGSLDDKPQPGIVLAQGMNEAHWRKAWDAFRTQQTTDVAPDWGKVMPIFSMDPTLPVKLENFTFAKPPEKFDYKVYVEIDIDQLALAIGVDRQEIAQLTGGNIGSQGQSVIQHAKSQGKMPGYIYASLERALNQALPESCEFGFKVKDAVEAQEEANKAQVWTGVALQLEPLLGKQIAMEILANQVEAVADAVLDDNGEYIRLDDADPKPAELDVTLDDAAPPTDVPAEGAPVELQLVKDFDATRAAFVSAFEDLAAAGLDGDLNRRRAGTVLRANVSRLGRAAYSDGLKQGGVEELSEDDLAAIAVLIAEQSGYVTAFMDTLFADGVTAGGITAHANAWANKSLQVFYDAGVLSADANGLYLWELGATEDHCADCQRMAGQKHRFKEYHDKGIYPKSDTLDCGGFQCDCRLTKTTGRAKGKW